MPSITRRAGVVHERAIPTLKELTAVLTAHTGDPIATITRHPLAYYGLGMYVDPFEPPERPTRRD